VANSLLFFMHIRKKKEKKRPNFSKLQIEGRKKKKKNPPCSPNLGTSPNWEKKKPQYFSPPNLKQIAAPPLPYSKRQNKTQKKIKKTKKLKKGEGNAEGSTMRKRRVDHDGAAGWKDGRTDGRTDGRAPASDGG
jgi:hypothetical protein